MGRIKKTDKKKEAGVHNELKGLDLKINEFGEVIGNTDIENINTFLDKHVTDKKLEDRSGKFGEEDAQEEEEK